MDILQMSLSSAVLIIAVVIVRAFTLHKLPKKTFLVLWGVVICRLLIPFSLPSRFSFFTGLDMLKRVVMETTDFTTHVETTGIPNIIAVSGTGQSIVVNTSTMTVSPITVIWLTGLCACALFFIVTYIKCHREFRTSLPVTNEFATLWLQEHPMRRPMQIRQSDKIKTPLTYGVFRPVILLPKNTDWTDETRLRYIFTHEFVHIRRFDALTKLLLASALCVHWFNPFVWVMYILANRDIELSCDETVVQTFGETMKSAYALTLIGLEEKKSRLTPLVNNFSKYAIEERINAIMKIKKTSLVGMILALALIIGTTIVFATNAVAAKEPENENVTITNAEEAVYVETPESKAEMFTVYEQYGLTYNISTDQLFYKRELVRYFEDYYPVGDVYEGASAGRDYINKDGTIDVHGVRDLSQLTRNADGSFDPSGKLIGVEPYSQADFDARDMEELINPSMQATSVDEPSVEGNFSTVQESSEDNQFSGYTYAVEAGPQSTPDEFAKMYAVYEPFGVTYDKTKDCFYYDGKLVRQFIDVLASNGESLSGGKFKGSMRQMGSPDGEIEIETVREYKNLDTDGYGKLIGIEVTN